jgi:hypothetical protein
LGKVTFSTTHLRPNNILPSINLSTTHSQSAKMGRGGYDVTELEQSDAGEIAEPTASNESVSAAQYVIDAHHAAQAEAEV